MSRCDYRISFEDHSGMSRSLNSAVCTLEGFLKELLYWPFLCVDFMLPHQVGERLWLGLRVQLESKPQPFWILVAVAMVRSDSR